MPTVLNITNSIMMNHNSCQAHLELGCSNLQVAITDTVIDSFNQCGLQLIFPPLTSNNSVMMNNFSGAVTVMTYENDLQLGNMCADEVDPGICFNQKGDSNAVLIENSTFIDYDFAGLINVENMNTRCNSGVKSALVTLRNVKVAQCSVGPALIFQGVIAKFVNCTFENNSITALQGFNSNLVFEGSNTFKNNSGYVGAGMILVESYMYLMPHTHILFQNNHVSYTGGAINLHSNAYQMQTPCFFSAVSTELRDTISVSFMNNTAGAGGTSLYGDFGNCCNPGECNEFYDIFNVSNTETDPSAIASEPSGLCICEGDEAQPNCSNQALSIHSYPGQEFAVRVAVISEPFFGAVQGIVDASTMHPNATLGPS